jgi:hypothetical protein
MRTLYKVLCLLSLAFSTELALDAKMPGQSLNLLNTNGTLSSLGDLKGDIGTLVIFSCNTCPWVIRWEDRYVEIAKKYTSKGINLIAVNSNSARFNGVDSIEEMKKHSKEKKYNFPYVQDLNSDLARVFGATKTPHVYLFNQSDRLVFRGAIDDNAKDPNQVEQSYLSNALDQMLSGRNIEKPISKAMGCSIKFN